MSRVVQRMRIAQVCFVIIHSFELIIPNFFLNFRFESYDSVYFKPLCRVQLKVKHSKILQRVRAVHIPTGRRPQREDSNSGTTASIVATKQCNHRAVVDGNDVPIMLFIFSLFLASLSMFYKTKIISLQLTIYSL